ncbi:hypothetical protein TSUD_252970 [Trifolium subterraneum]|nr:hypothetical protein TSUD_252970 [Trifolium subterraneum]
MSHDSSFPSSKYSNGDIEARTQRKEHKNKEMPETCLYTLIKVARDEDLAEQIGKDIYFDLVDFEKVRSFRVQKDTSFKVFKAIYATLFFLVGRSYPGVISLYTSHSNSEKNIINIKMLQFPAKEDVAKEFGIPARFQRFWLWAKRQNYTFRPWRPLTHIEEAGPVGQVIEVTKVHKAESKLFLHVERGLDLRPIAPLEKRWDDILLFFKLYDPEKEELRYDGRLFVNSTSKPSEILTKLNKLAGYEPDEAIELYEENWFEPNVVCEPVVMNLTYEGNQLKNGDIICFQKAPATDNEKHIRYPDVPSYLEYVHSRLVPFSSSDKESKDEESSVEEIENIIDKKKIQAMIDEDIIVAIDKVLSEGITILLLSQRFIQVSKKSLEVQELRDIVFKENLFEKFKDDITAKVIFNAVKENFDANATDLFSSNQLEQVSVVVDLLNNIVRMFEKLRNLNKELDSTKKCTDQNNEALKETRQKILISKNIITYQQTQLNYLDAEIVYLKAKLEKLQGERAKNAEIQDQEEDNITSLNKEVKSIFHRLADDYIKLKSVEDKIVEAQADLESHEKLYQFFRANPPF